MVDAGDVGGGLMADGALVVCGGHGTVLLEAAEAVFRGIAVFVCRGVGVRLLLRLVLYYAGWVSAEGA